MELMCPVCGKWTEIPENQAFAGNRCRCRECWVLFRIESHRPFRVQVEEAVERFPAQAGVGALQEREEHG